MIASSQGSSMARLCRYCRKSPTLLKAGIRLNFDASGISMRVGHSANTSNFRWWYVHYQISRKSKDEWPGSWIRLDWKNVLALACMLSAANESSMTVTKTAHTSESVSGRDIFILPTPAALTPARQRHDA